MKLLDVTFRDVVRDPVSTGLSRFYSTGYELSVDAGMVSVRKDGKVRTVPMSNVVDMTVAEEARKK